MEQGPWRQDRGLDRIRMNGGPDGIKLDDQYDHADGVRTDIQIEKG
jgi:hypothetical protein